MSTKHIVEINLTSKYIPSIDVTAHEELQIRLEAVLSMAKLIDDGSSNRIASIIIDADKALKIVNRKRWWQFWK